jgi:hypothetical protein
MNSGDRDSEMQEGSYARTGRYRKIRRQEKIEEIFEA